MLLQGKPGDDSKAKESKSEPPPPALGATVPTGETPMLAALIEAPPGKDRRADSPATLVKASKDDELPLADGHPVPTPPGGSSRSSAIKGGDSATPPVFSMGHGCSFNPQLESPSCRLPPCHRHCSPSPSPSGPGQGRVEAESPGILPTPPADAPRGPCPGMGCGGGGGLPAFVLAPLTEEDKRQPTHLPSSIWEGKRRP